MKQIFILVVGVAIGAVAVSVFNNGGSSKKSWHVTVVTRDFFGEPVKGTDKPTIICTAAAKDQKCEVLFIE